MTAAKKAQGLIFDIVRDIAADKLAPGDRLPSQAEMMRRYQVGPTPLREALRMLELAGLLSLRPGPNAGAVLEAATAQHLAGVLAPFLSMSGVSYGQLLDAWAASEPLLAAAAAGNPDRERVALLLGPFADEVQSDEPVAAPRAIDFHDAVAEAAGNRALALVLQALSYVVADLYWASTATPPPGGQVRDDHKSIAQAILSGDAAAAGAEMEAHARGISSSILARIGHVRDDPFVWPRPPAGLAAYRRRPAAPTYAGESGSAK